MRDRVLEVRENWFNFELRARHCLLGASMLAFSSVAHARDSKPTIASTPYVAAPSSVVAAHDVGKKDRFAPLQLPIIIRAPAYIVIDADSGRVLKEFSSRRRMFPASTTKTLTALTALRHAKPGETIRVGPNPPKVGESSAYLLEGEQFTLADLLRAAMIKSANDACVAIAEGVGGDVPTFAKLMNAEARRVGALDSHFVNPSGLHDAKHYTTAHDLALIARAAMTSPFFAQIVRAREVEIHGNWKLGGNRVLVNKNRLLCMWKEVDGVKTGYTRQAGRCLIASATRRVRDSKGQMRNWRLISVVMHSPDTWGESARLLLDGFTYFRPVPVARKGESVGEIEVQGGAHAVEATVLRDVNLPLKSGERVLEVGAKNLNENRDALSLTRRVRLQTLRAPLHRGQTVGTIEWISRGKTVAIVPLIAPDDVPVAIAARVVPMRFAPSNTTLWWSVFGALSLGTALVLLRRTRA